MKKLLLLLGFLPCFAFAQDENLSPDRMAVTQFVSEALNYAYLEHFTEDYYQRFMKLYQTKYDMSDKNAKCNQTITALKNNLDFQRQLYFYKIKTTLVAPSVANLSDKQVENVLKDTKTDFFIHPSNDSEQLMELIKQKIGTVKEDGTPYDINDALKNCPAKN